jgi:hypothetical protein
MVPIAVLEWLVYDACPSVVVLGRLSSRRCPLVIVLWWLSCGGCPFVNVAWLPCGGFLGLGCPVLAALFWAGVYILENTPSPGGDRKNISQCHLGEKYEKANRKRGKM